MNRINRKKIQYTKTLFTNQIENSLKTSTFESIKFLGGAFKFFIEVNENEIFFRFPSILSR